MDHDDREECKNATALETKSGILKGHEGDDIPAAKEISDAIKKNLLAYLVGCASVAILMYVLLAMLGIFDDIKKMNRTLPTLATKDYVKIENGELKNDIKKELNEDTQRKINELRKELLMNQRDTLDFLYIAAKPDDELRQRIRDKRDAIQKEIERLGPTP